MDLKKLKNLLSSSSKMDPNMGDVKQADRNVGLGVRPQLKRGYGEDQDTMEMLRDSARRQAEYGFAANEPNEQDLEKQKMLEGLAFAGMGTVSKASPELVTNAIRKLKDLNATDRVKEFIRIYEQSGKQITPEIFQILEKKFNPYGSVKIK